MAPARCLARASVRSASPRWWRCPRTAFIAVRGAWAPSEASGVGEAWSYRASIPSAAPTAVPSVTAPRAACSAAPASTRPWSLPTATASSASPRSRGHDDRPGRDRRGSPRYGATQHACAAPGFGEPHESERVATAWLPCGTAPARCRRCPSGALRPARRPSDRADSGGRASGRRSWVLSAVTKMRAAPREDSGSTPSCTDCSHRPRGVRTALPGTRSGRGGREPQAKHSRREPRLEHRQA